MAVDGGTLYQRAMPLLYSFRRCPYAMRARLALLVGRVPFVLQEVSLRDKPAAMILASPKGTVPVLVLEDERVIDESLDIMRYALAIRDPEDWLGGDDAALIAANDGPFKYHLDRYKYPERHDADLAEHRHAGLALLSALDDRLASHANLCRDARALTDMAVMPFVRQFAAVDREWFATTAPADVQRWLAAHIASPLFEAAMAK